jgi:hypothetical protein
VRSRLAESRWTALISCTINGPNRPLKKSFCETAGV